MSDEDFNKYEKEAQAAINLVNERKTDEFIDLTEKSLGFKKKFWKKPIKILNKMGNL